VLVINDVDGRYTGFAVKYLGETLISFELQFEVNIYVIENDVITKDADQTYNYRFSVDEN
jgi:hypothetical protein